MPFHLLKTLIRNSSLLFIFFSSSHLTRNHDANRAPRAYIYALEASFSQVAKNCHVFCQTVGGVFLTLLPKIKDGNSICQTAGDANLAILPQAQSLQGSKLGKHDRCANPVLSYYKDPDATRTLPQHQT